MAVALQSNVASAAPRTRAVNLRLDSDEGLKPVNAKIEPVTFRGRKALRVSDTAPEGTSDAGRYVIVTGSEFENGVIEVDLAGDHVPSAPGSRGFVGIAFRVAPDSPRFECFYLRTYNGRSEDQLQRNHSAQYISYPDYPWQRLRQETPGRYESYVDLVPGRWTHLKIEVQGAKARLYVDGAAQPALIVNDLKHGNSKGAVALWIGPGTIAHFANLKITR